MPNVTITLTESEARAFLHEWKREKSQRDHVYPKHGVPRDTIRSRNAPLERVAELLREQLPSEPDLFGGQ